MVMTNQEDLQGMVNQTAASAGEYAGIFADITDDENCCADCPRCDCAPCPNCGGGDGDERENLDPLEVKWEYSQVSNGLMLSTITLVASTGGPHIEIVLTSGRTEAVGYWGGCTPAHSYIAQDIGRRMWDYFEELDPVALGVGVNR